jgi:hypothetical protein
MRRPSRGAPDDIASRWGPRIVDLVKQMVEAIAALQK